MHNPTSDCHYLPWLQLLYLMWPPVEVLPGPYCFIATHGVNDDDDQDNEIKYARQEEKRFHYKT